MKQIIEDFIEWAQDNAPDAWWIYENTDEAIEKYLKFKAGENKLP
jgi:hypothetical protein